MATNDSCATFELFARLTPAERTALSEVGREVRYDTGSRLFDEGDVASGCWLIHRGRVALETDVPGKGLVVIQTLGAGDIVGWSWLVPPYRWHFRAHVVEPLRATLLDTDELRALAERDPQFGYALAQQLLAAVLDRLQATRARLLDLYGGPDGR